MRTRISVEDYERMNVDRRCELLRGEVVLTSPIGDFHAWCVKALGRFFMNRANSLLDVGTRTPIVLPDSEPEPDIVLSHYRQDEYRYGKPRAGDVVLLIEVADSSLELNRDLKGPLYAENGIPEYWILNLGDECLEVYTEPQAAGYARLETSRPGDSIPIPGLPGVDFPVGKFL